MSASSLRLLVGVALLLAALPAAAPAAAAEDPLLRYGGVMTLSTSDGVSAELTATLLVDCTAEPCTAEVIVAEGDYSPPVSNGQAFPLTSGTLSVALPESGEICTLHWVGAGQLDIAVGPTSATVSRTSAASGERDCGDGTTAEASSGTISGTLAYQSGSACLLDASCPKAESPIPPAHYGIPPSVVPSEPSTFGLLPTLEQAVTPAKVAWAAGGALVLVLIVSFPSALLNGATEEFALRYEQRRRGRSKRRPAAAPPFTVLGWPLALAGLGVAAVASALVDPDFGFTPLGARIALTVLASFLVAIAICWLVVGVVMRRAFPATLPRIEFRPLTLIIVAAAVIVSRLVGFEPGIVFGLVAGIGFGAVLATSHRAIAELVGVGYLLVVATAAWIAYSAIVGSLGPHPAWPVQFGVETLSAITITGAAALPIALLPLRGLTGHAIWSWNRWVWAASYLVASAAFLLVLLPLPQSWSHVSLALWAWAAGYVFYCVLAVAFWLIVVRHGPRRRRARGPRPRSEPHG